MSCETLRGQRSAACLEGLSTAKIRGLCQRFFLIYDGVIWQGGAVQFEELLPERATWPFIGFADNLQTIAHNLRDVHLIDKCSPRPTCIAQRVRHRHEQNGKRRKGLGHLGDDLVLVGRGAKSRFKFFEVECHSLAAQMVAICTIEPFI